MTAMEGRQDLIIARVRKRICFISELKAFGFPQAMINQEYSKQITWKLRMSPEMSPSFFLLLLLHVLPLAFLLLPHSTSFVFLLLQPIPFSPPTFFTLPLFLPPPSSPSFFFLLLPPPSPSSSSWIFPSFLCSFFPLFSSSDIFHFANREEVILIS